MKNTNYLVKKHQTYRLLLLLMLICGTVEAKVDNYFGLYVQGGEWTLLPSQSESSMSLGGAGGVGFLYELQAGSRYSSTRFLFDVGLGAQGGITSFMQNTMTQSVLPSIDLQGDSFDYIYEMTNRSDRYGNLAVQVPLLIGVQSGRFYLLAGVKIGANVISRARSTADITTYGHYLEFGDICNNPDVQFFDSYPVSTRSQVSMKLGMDISLEVGGRLGLVTNAVGYDISKHNVEYRLAGFIDYGISDIHTAHTLAKMQTPTLYDINPASADYVYRTTTMVDGVLLNDIMSTDGFASKVSNLLVGLKFTVLFQLPGSNGGCTICRDAYRSSSNRRGGGVKYEE